MVNISAGILFFDLIESFGFRSFSILFLGFYEFFVCFIQSLIYSLLVINYNEEAQLNL
jgi:F0F1-type ATP synthase membrane subunit a